jgi:RNA polymerase sigma-70 factor (ECF subfamily)
MNQDGIFSPTRGIAGLPCRRLVIAMPDEPEDQVNVGLLGRVAQGDQGAFMTLYGRLAPALYDMALRMMNDPQEAEDVLQEGFTYLWRKAAAFDPARSSAFAWAVLIVRHKAIDRLRLRQRDQRRRETMCEVSELEVPVDERSAQELAWRERSGEARAALEQLAPEQRSALELAFFGGLTRFLATFGGADEPRPAGIPV